MKLKNTFTVPVTADVAWPVLLDVERIAPCMPGATLTGQDGDSFTGTVKVKVGPVSLTYGGTARFASVDEAGRVVVIEASGKETRGSGTAKAAITARLTETDGSTTVDVETDLTITGKPAQFGRGVMAEISGKLITQFANCLAEKIVAEPTSPPAGAGVESAEDASGDDDSAAADAEAEPPPLRSVTASAPRPTPEAIDLLDTAGLPILKRLGPPLAALGVIAFLLLRRRRH